VKIVLEPIFEADMLACSFGFRSRRAPHDALQVLVDESWRGRRWVVETDIANCLDAWSYCFPSDCHGWNSVCSGVGGSIRSPFRRPVRT
jgi:hypothetical protein